MQAAEPEGALHLLSDALRGDEVIAPHVRDPGEPPTLGLLVAAGPRAAGDPGEYAVLVEAVREGYLLHYGEPRLLAGADPDLRLLAGDYLYALGLERLAARGDLESVRELADLISLSAQLHAMDGAGSGDDSAALWLASVLAVAAGSSAHHERGKRALREGTPGARELLAGAATAAADRIGASEQLTAAARLLSVRLG